MTKGRRYVIDRDHNVVRVDFRRRPDPPQPKFPGGAALRALVFETVEAFRPGTRMAAA